MNVKFKMPKFGEMSSGKSMLRELLMTTIGTTISIVLTFGTAAWLDADAHFCAPPRQCVAAILDMKGAKLFIDDFTGGFVPYFESSIENVLEINSNNMAIIGVTREELKDFIRAQE